MSIGVTTLPTPLVVAASVAPFILITPKPFRNINGLVFDIVVEERHREEVTITQHPVEQGAPVTDHSYVMPNEVVIRAGSSLSPPPGQPARPATYLHDLYKELQAFKVQRIPFQVVTGKAIYNNMLLRILEAVTDEHRENILEITAHCREVITVTTQIGQSLQNSNMASPQNTGVTQNTGTRQLQPAPSYRSVPYAPATGTPSTGTAPFSSGFASGLM